MNFGMKISIASRKPGLARDTKKPFKNVGLLLHRPVRYPPPSRNYSVYHFILPCRE